MFKELMHTLIGQSAQNAYPGQAMNSYPGGVYVASGASGGGGSGSGLAMHQVVVPKEREALPKSKKLFHGSVEVLQVANGYIVNIGRKEGYEYETYIAETITGVNERIAAAIVAFQLESK